MRILITGITGFAGSHLAEYILRNHPEHKVFGTTRYRSQRDNLSEEVLNGVILVDDIDFRDAACVKKLIYDLHPNKIFHLAADSYVPASWRNPGSVINNNIQSQINIFEAVREIPQLAMETVIQIAGSSEEYGFVQEDECPISETNPLRPLSPYAVSKIAQDMLGYQYYESHALSVIRTRAFNHTGPRRGEFFVCSSFAKQIVEMELGLKEPLLKVGNLDAVRDFTDVRDTVRAYWLLSERGTFGDVYNIGSGKGHKIKDILEILLGFSSVGVRYEIDNERMRPSDVPRLICDNRKLTRETFWVPEYNIVQTLLDLLDYWRDKLAT